MRWLFVVGLLVIITLAACAGKEDVLIDCKPPFLFKDAVCCPDHNYDSLCDPVEARRLSISTIEPPNAPIVTETKTSLLSSVKKWQALTTERVRSYSFSGQAKDQYHSKFFLRNNMIRIDLEHAIKVNVGFENEGMVNKIFIDTARRQAVGVCSAGYTLCVSRKGDVYDIPFNTYTPVLPTDVWSMVLGMPLASETVGAEVIDNRKVTLLLFQDSNGDLVKVYVDEYYGVPLRLSREKNGKKKLGIQFKQIAFNSVSDKDMNLPVLPAAR